MSKRIACFELENYTKSKIKVKSSYQLVPKLTDKTVLVNEQLTSIIDEFKVLTTQQMISSDFYDECNHITLIGYETSELLKTTMISLLNDALDRIKLIDDNSKAFKEDLAQCEAEFAKALGTITGLETITKSLVDSTTPDLAEEPISEPVSEEQTESRNLMEEPSEYRNLLEDTNEGMVDSSRNLLEGYSDTLSYERASEIAEAWNLTPEEVMGYNLPADYQLGDSLLPEGVLPSQVKYASENGNPILYDGFPQLDKHTVTGHNGKAYNKAAYGAGDEINFARMGFFGPEEFNGDYFTWYGPVCNQSAIHNTQQRFYTCDDGFYRDGDGYIVCACDKFNNYVGGRRVDNGGLSEADRIVPTPFGLARMYDNCGLPSISSRKYCDDHIDLYRNDGYEGHREGLLGSYEEVYGPVVRTLH